MAAAPAARAQGKWKPWVEGRRTRRIKRSQLKEALKMRFPVCGYIVGSGWGTKDSKGCPPPGDTSLWDSSISLPSPPLNPKANFFEDNRATVINRLQLRVISPTLARFEYKLAFQPWREFILRTST